MKKSVVGIVFLLIVVGVVVGLVFATKSATPNEEEKGSQKEENKRGSVKFLNSKLEESTITQKYKAYINGKDIDLEVVFNYSIESVDPSENQGYNRIEKVVGKFKDIILFDHEEKTNSQSQKAELFETNKIDKAYNGDYFKVVRGTDGKDYLAIATHIYDIDYDNLRENYLYILNDNLSVINNIFPDSSNCSNKNKAMVIHPGLIGLLSDSNIWYKNQFSYDNHRKNYTMINVTDDKIYYLYNNINVDSNGNYGNIEERVYTIANDKLEYKMEKMYRAEGMYGDICS